MSLYDITANRLDGSPCHLGEFRGQVLLIVNVASRCGFTPQYAGLEALQQEFSAQGFTVLAFPCNQFGAQEPGAAAEIASFCDINYHVTFPLFEKIEVNGTNAHPLYQFLKAAKPGILGTEAIKWNFTKFLIDRQGAVVQRFAPNETPAALHEHIAALL